MNVIRSSLTFPEPSARPGQAPDLTEFDFVAAGEVPVPSLDMRAEDSRVGERDLVRVLDETGKAVGPWTDLVAEVADADALLRGLKDIMRMRAVDRRLLTAQRQGKTSFYLQCTGEEAIGCAFQRRLTRADMNFPTYRQQSLLIGADYPLDQLMGQVYSNAADPLNGRQLPIMHSAREHGFFSISGNLGTQFVQAVGWAMANALRGDGGIAAGWIGDGATASNDFHAALLTASVYKPPVILCIVNNQWAISTFTGLAVGAGGTLAARSLGYGLPALRVDGNDYLAVTAASEWALRRVRGGHGPVVIEWVTYRVAAHSTSDDPGAYRPRDEPAVWPLGDPVERLKSHLIELGSWSNERHTQYEAEVDEEVREVQRTVEAMGTMIDPRPVSPSMMFENVYANPPEHLLRQRQEAGY